MTTSHRPCATARPARRPWAALVLVAVLVLGGGAHLWHHLVDTACDEGHGPGVHPCVACSSLHGGALVGAVVTAAPPAPVGFDALVAPRCGRPVAPASHAGVPRAPPVA